MKHRTPITYTEPPAMAQANPPIENLRAPAASEVTTLHRAIYEELVREVTQGVYQPGDRLPSEAAFCERFGASRITVAKAIQALQRDGLVTRRPGSGTYVQQPKTEGTHQFGLLIPQLGSTEIFEPICQGIMRASLPQSHVLIWGRASGDGDTDLGGISIRLCQQFIDQAVAGVFFTPLEFTSDKDNANRQIVEMLARAKIPVVLLDRCYEAYPDRSALDLVGIDNHRAGYVVTRHLLRQGARRILFVAHKQSAPTILNRAAGYQFALAEAQPGNTGRVCYGNVNDPMFVRSLLADPRPDGIVCGNDLTAANLMRALLDIGVKIPESIRLVGFDNVSYARFLPVPLTTIHQDCSEIGRAALSLMLARIREPHRTAWDVRVPFSLVVRQSCGAELRAEPKAHENRSLSAS